MQIISNNTISIQSNINSINSVTSEYNHSVEIFHDSLKKINILINDLVDRIKKE